jgi:2'-hydroxyisoflavone reductase
MTGRREFIRTAALASASFTAVPRNLERLAGPSLIERRAPRPLKILILGGTGLTGPHQVRYALTRGHNVTVFNRGRRNDRLPKGVTELQGDRNLRQVDALRGKEWDVVIDNPTTLPFWVRDVGEVLKDHTRQYVFISTISVYETAGRTKIDEDSPLLEYTEGDPLLVTQQQASQRFEFMYGRMKTASEREARKWFGDRTTIIRPTLIVGPGDGSFRFTYWPYRIMKGGEILAPGDGTDRVQLIDARDLAEWTIRMVEEGTTGTFNAAGPRSPLTMAEQLYGIRAAFDGNRDVRFTWVPADFLAQQKVAPWSDMPTWFPKTDPDYVVALTSNQRAVSAGLTFRALAISAVDALAWFEAAPETARAQMVKAAGLDADRERAVLLAWRAAKS